MNLVERGSQTAKDGFRNEDDIVKKFNEWKKDKDAQAWLIIMKYNLSEIEYVEAVKISGYKTDVQVQVTIKLKKAIDVENLQVKLVSNPKGFNQIDKRWVDKYSEMWNIPLQVISILKRYTGEEKPTIKKPKDKRRRWILKPMNFCMNYFGNGDIEITNRGNFKIGRIKCKEKVVMEAGILQRCCNLKLIQQNCLTLNRVHTITKKLAIGGLKSFVATETLRLPPIANSLTVIGNVLEIEFIQKIIFEKL